MSATGLVVLVATLLLAAGLGLLLRARSGRVRAPRAGNSADADGWRIAGGDAQSDARVLLLQLSSPVCAPCRQAAAVLAEVSERAPGVRHVEIDLAERPGVARELGVRRTPTTIAFDRSGTELLRISGVPRVPDLLHALGPALSSAPAADHKMG